MVNDLGMVHRGFFDHGSGACGVGSGARCCPKGDDLHGPETFYILRSGDPPPQKKSCHFNRETYDKLLDDVGCCFFFTLNLRRTPFLGWF